MTEVAKQVLLLKIKTVLRVIWVILKPILIVVGFIGFVIFGAIVQILGASMSGKGRR